MELDLEHLAVEEESPEGPVATCDWPADDQEGTPGSATMHAPIG